MHEVTTSFLTSGPNLTIQLPEVLLPTPVLDSPISTSDTGGRSFTYYPEPFQPPSFDDGSHLSLESLKSEFGPIAVIERIEDPRQWYMVWRLNKGSLLTHVRDEDGYGAVETIAGVLEIAEGPDGSPVLLPNPPMKRAAARVPGYLETITFYDTANAPVAFMRLERPGAMRSSQGYTSDGELIVATGLGIDIHARGLPAKDVEDVTDQIVQQIQGTDISSLQ